VCSGEENLLDRITRMATTNPLWVDMTWRAQAGLCESTLELCKYITNYLGMEVLMHITCTGMTREYIISALDRAKDAGIRNILALRGDPPFGVKEWTAVENGFSNAGQIVKFIKERYGDFFCIIVAGYPEVHL
jgi:methylenetetrahydrofolate reductase (NADPH)